MNISVYIFEMFNCSPIHIKGPDQFCNSLTWRDHAIKNRLHDSRHSSFNQVVIIKQVMQMLINHTVHPGKHLLLTPLLKDTGFLRYLRKGLHYFPLFFEACFLNGRTTISMGLPAFSCRANEFYHSFILTLSNKSSIKIVTISLIDYNGIS